MNYLAMPALLWLLAPSAAHAGGVEIPSEGTVINASKFTSTINLLSLGLTDHFR